MEFTLFKDILAYVIVPLGSAFIGTWWGSKKLASYKEDEKKKIRNIAQKGLQVFQKYANKEMSYKAAENEFNASLSIAEKRAVLVALHKFGIPIEIPVESEFSISHVTFLDEKISLNNLDDITTQIEKGYGDALFFLDAENYFNENLRIKTLRALAKKYVREFLMKSELDPSSMEVIFPCPLFEKFSYFEVNAILVFRKITMSDVYYLDNNKVNEDRARQLLIDIDRGLCDIYLNTDITFYNNICNQNRVAEMNIEQMKNIYRKEIRK